MNDMIVRLYDLPNWDDLCQSLLKDGIFIRRAMLFEARIIVRWVEKTYGEGWAVESETAFYRNPSSCFIATKKNEILGFSVYDCTCKNFFGPTGVIPEYRGKGIGKALLLAAFHAMRQEGYGYGIIGSAGPVDFYKKILDAQVIDKSIPGVYANRLNVSKECHN